MRAQIGMLSLISLTLIVMEVVLLFGSTGGLVPGMLSPSLAVITSVYSSVVSRSSVERSERTPVEGLRWNTPL